MTEQPVATLYLRSATHDDDSIADQSRICTEHAAAQGWRVGEIFIDNGASGVCNDRPGIESLRGCLREERASVVIAEDASRVCRDLEEFNGFVAFCHAHDAGISFARPTGSTEGLMQRLFEDDLAGRKQRTLGRTTA